MGNTCKLNVTFNTRQANKAKLFLNAKEEPVERRCKTESREKLLHNQIMTSDNNLQHDHLKNSSL